MGLRLIIARNGQDGIDMAHSELPDLILMDIGLPDIDGMESTKRLRGTPDTHHIPIIAVTAHAMNGDREQCLAAGCDEYLPKPFQVGSLRKILDRFLTQ
jgi:CheY-like chemotaxis protein